MKLTMKSTGETGTDSYGLGRRLLALAAIAIMATFSSSAIAGTQTNGLTGYSVDADGHVQIAAEDARLNRIEFSISMATTLDGDGTVLTNVDQIRVALKDETSIGVHAVDPDKLDELAKTLDIDVTGRDLLQLTALAVKDVEMITPKAFSDGVMAAFKELGNPLSTEQIAIVREWTTKEIGVYTTAALGGGMIQPIKGGGMAPMGGGMQRA